MAFSVDPVDHVLHLMDQSRVSLHQVILSAFDSSRGDPIGRFLLRRSYGNPGSSQVATVLDAFLNDPETSSQTSAWACRAAQAVLLREMQTLTHVSAGFHFNARAVTTARITGFSLADMARKLRGTAPHLWDIILALLDASGRHQKHYAEAQAEAAVFPPVSFCELEESADAQEEDELYWGEVEDLTDDELRALQALDLEALERASRTARRKLRAAERHRAIQPIRAVAVLSILMQSSNGRCNGLASILAFFMQSRHTPDAVIEVFAHIGLSVSPTTVRRMVDSLIDDNKREIFSLAARWILNIGYDNLNLGFKTSQQTVEKQNTWFNVTSGTFLALLHAIPRHLMVSAFLWKTSPLNYARPSDSGPVFRMNYTDIAKLLPRRSYLPPVELFHVLRILVINIPAFSRFKSDLGTRPQGTETELEIPVARTVQYPARTMRIDESSPDAQGAILDDMLQQAGYSQRIEELRNYVMFVHGDLGTLEKLDSLIKSRRIEESPETRLQFVLGMPGLFHTKMATAESLWRTYIEPFVSKSDKTSIYTFACKLRPKESAKIGTKPTYRQLHDVIQYVTTASILDCWTILVKEHGHQSLDAFAATSPSWAQLVQLAEQLVLRFVAGEQFAVERRAPADRRDETFENGKLWHRDAILYLELCHAMTHGHIGRVENCLAFWIFIFAAVGKHKYATYTSRFLTNLRYVFPAETARAVRMNWLCNPSGKADGFRGVDWLLEINNMLQKTIHCGDGSNRTLDHIIKHSPLTELYRACLTLVETNFHLTHRYIRHQPPDMTRTIREMTATISASKVHVNRPGTKAKVLVHDKLAYGMHKLQQLESLVVKLDGVPDAQITSADPDDEFADLLTDEEILELADM